MHLDQEGLALWVKHGGVIGEREEVDLDQIRGARPQTVAFALARELVRAAVRGPRRRDPSLALPAPGRDLKAVARRVRDHRRRRNEGALDARPAWSGSGGEDLRSDRPLRGGAAPPTARDAGHPHLRPAGLNPRGELPHSQGRDGSPAREVTPQPRRPRRPPGEHVGGGAWPSISSRTRASPPTSRTSALASQFPTSTRAGATSTSPTSWCGSCRGTKRTRCAH